MSDSCITSFMEKYENLFLKYLKLQLVVAANSLKSYLKSNQRKNQGNLFQYNYFNKSLEKPMDRHN